MNGTREIIGAAIEVHRHLGPGPMEAAYEACLAHELRRRGIDCVRQPAMPLVYKGMRVERAYQPDLIVADRVIVEVEAIQALLPVNLAQLRTYLRLCGRSIGLLINFNVAALRNGGIRRVNPSLSRRPLRLPPEKTDGA